MSQRRTLAVIVVAYLLSLTVAVVWSFNWNGTQGGKVDDFIKLAGTWFTALTTALGAAVTLIVMFAQRDATAKLEQLKGEVAKGVKFAEYRLSRAGQAADAISNAMSTFYYQYAGLENDTFIATDALKADREMGSVSARLTLFSGTLSTAFTTFFQEGRNLHDELRNLGEAADATKRKALWTRYARSFGDKLANAQDELRKALKHAFEQETG